MAAPGLQPYNIPSTQPDEPVLNSVEPSTPQDNDLAPESSQITLPPTEVPNSPIDTQHSFKSEPLNDRASAAVIPSSLTPPPSSQVANFNANVKRSTLQASQGSILFSPPATVLQPTRDRDTLTSDDYLVPSSEQIKNASADDLRNMLQTCIAENQKLKMETAHHKLQLNLLNLQAENDLERAAVEHDMIRAEVDAIRSSDYFLQTKRELSAAAEAHQIRLQVVTNQCDSALEENKLLQRKIRSAKKVIMQKEEETQNLTEERDMLLNRIRENREHFQMLCSPGGILHGALTPKAAISTPQQAPRATPRQTPRSALRGPEDAEHGLSALLQAMSQDNNSAPSTPIVPSRGPPRQMGKHHRNVQSLSSLPTTPQSQVRGGNGSLLPSISIVPQSEPQRHTARHFLPTTPTPKHDRRRKSRESTISVDENEELARQALESAAAVQPYTAPSQGSNRGGYTSVRGASTSYREDEDRDMYESQASQAASEMLRRDPRESFDVASSMSSEDGTRDRQPKGYANVGDKRKLSGNYENHDHHATVNGKSPNKRLRAAGSVDEASRVGLGIQYER